MLLEGVGLELKGFCGWGLSLGFKRFGEGGRLQQMRGGLGVIGCSSYGLRLNARACRSRMLDELEPQKWDYLAPGKASQGNHADAGLRKP